VFAPGTTSKSRNPAAQAPYNDVNERHGGTMAFRWKAWTEGRLITAFCLILVGLLLLMPYIGFDWSLDLWDFWPCLLILHGTSVLGRSEGRRADGWLWIFFGALFMGSNLGFYRMHIGFVWPLLIIALGVMLLARSRPAAAPSDPDRKPAGTAGPDRGGSSASGFRSVSDTSETPQILWILGGAHQSVESRRFRSAQVTSVLSKGQIDLTRAEVEGEAEIDALSILGTVEVIVPKGWEVVMHGTSLVGSMKDETGTSASPGRSGSPSAKRIVIKGLALFGDVIVRNG
jgi:predicted membrane protein